MKWNKKYIYYFAFFVVMLFVFNIKVEAQTTYTLCEYELDHADKSEEDPISNELGIKVLYRNNKMVYVEIRTKVGQWVPILSIDNIDNIENATKNVDVFDPFNIATWYGLLCKTNLYDSLKSIENNQCHTSSVVSDGYINTDISNIGIIAPNSNFYYKLSNSEKYQIDDLNCTYNLKEKSSHKDEKFPGKEVTDASGNKVWEFSPITVFLFSDMVRFLPSSTISNDKKFDVKSFNIDKGKNEFLGYVLGSKDKLENYSKVSNSMIYSEFEYFSKVKDQVYGVGCPKYLLFNDKEGFYLSMGKLSLGKVGSNFDPQGSNSGYALYVLDEEKYNYQQCYNFTISKISELESNFASVTSELVPKLDGYIKDKNLTKDKAQEINRTYNQKIDAIRDEFSKRDKLKVSCTDYEKLQIMLEEKANSLVNLQKNDVGIPFKNAVNSSSLMSDEEKKEVLGENQEIIDNARDELKKLSKLEFTSITGTNPGCEDIFGSADDANSIRSLINTIMTYVKIIVPILLIVFGCLDFGKAVIASDQEALKKAQSAFVKRVIAAVLIFFLPMLINLVMDIINKALGVDLEYCLFIIK